MREEEKRGEERRQHEEERSKEKRSKQASQAVGNKHSDRTNEQTDLDQDTRRRDQVQIAVVFLNLGLNVLHFVQSFLEAQTLVDRRGHLLNLFESHTDIFIGRISWREREGEKKRRRRRRKRRGSG
jgi:hypothetical protein